MSQKDLQDFIDALRRREWRAIRRMLLGLLLPGATTLYTFRASLDPYQIPAFVVAALLALLLVRSEIRDRRGRTDPGPIKYTSTIRGLLSFGEDDAEAFAALGRATDVQRVVNALLAPDFRFGVVYGESGCGKTSLLRAGVLPALRSRNHVCHLDDITNQEQPLDLVMRLLNPSAGAGPSAQGANGMAGAHAWLAQLDAGPRPVVLILDQFEQFFLHYGRQEQQEPFLAFLQEWWTQHPASQLRILVGIREDYVGKLAPIHQRLAYARTIHNELQLKKFRPDDAAEVLRSMATWNGLEFHEAPVREACRVELASKEDGTVSPVDLQILAIGVLNLPTETRGFTAAGLRTLGGLEGALESYLHAQFSVLTGDDRNAALAVLRVLSELEQGLLAGFLSAEEIVDRLGKEYGEGRVRDMVRWLAGSGVRLTIERAMPDGTRCRLVHDRLVAAVTKLSGQLLVPAAKASELLNRRVVEYLNNNRGSRFCCRGGN